MRRIFYLIFFLFYFSSFAHAFELIMIQAVSDTKRTFITRHGKRQGVIKGTTGTFTADNVAVIAKAINVTGENTQWELTHSDAILPFEKGAIVTFYHSEEHIWALTTEQTRQKYIKSMNPDPRKSFIVKGAMSRGLSDSVSNAPASPSTRGSYIGEIYYEQDLYKGLAFDIGARYEKEIINYQGIAFTTRRNLLIADILYYFNTLQDILRGKLFIALGIGYGVSTTATLGINQSGQVGLLPAARAGINYAINDDWGFVFEVGFESLQTKEVQFDGRDQTTTQTNFKTGIGLRRYF